MPDPERPDLEVFRVICPEDGRECLVQVGPEDDPTDFRPPVEWCSRLGEKKVSCGRWCVS